MRERRAVRRRVQRARAGEGDGAAGVQQRADRRVHDDVDVGGVVRPEAHVPAVVVRVGQDRDGVGGTRDELCLEHTREGVRHAIRHVLQLRDVRRVGGAGRVAQHEAVVHVAVRVALLGHEAVHRRRRRLADPHLTRPAVVARLVARGGLGAGADVLTRIVDVGPIEPDAEVVPRVGRLRVQAPVVLPRLGLGAAAEVLSRHRRVVDSLGEVVVRALARGRRGLGQPGHRQQRHDGRGPRQRRRPHAGGQNENSHQ
mmetsp:Transcript_24294/g.75227  ORF Transcript_24294/g.75227 Transcript_24294/m.75227 type:complete len:256 (-) Transcript_24294:17-784(-)